MKEVEANKHLFGYPSAQMQWHAFEVVPFDYFVEIYSENFKYETEVVAIGSLMYETVKEADYVGVVLAGLLVRIVVPKGLLPLRGRHLLIYHLQYLHFVIAGL